MPLIPMLAVAAIKKTSVIATIEKAVAVAVTLSGAYAVIKKNLSS